MSLRSLRFLLAAGLLALPLGLTACDDNDGPAEEAGEQIDRSVDRAGDALEDAGDAIERRTDN